MPTTTSRLKIPYPLPSDRVADFPTTAAALANKLDDLITPSTHTLTAHTGWELTTPTIRSSCATHTAGITAKRTREGFNTTPNNQFQIATIPTETPTPPTGSIVGHIQFGTNLAPLIADGKNILCHPTASFTVNKNDIGIALITWIA
mgnify:CR=1 FL=1